MNIENTIKSAYEESLNNARFGDKIEEIDAIQSTIKSAKNVTVATSNEKKFKVVSDIISRITDANISMLEIPTNSADLTRMPALNKGLIAVDSSDADLIITRGRLGIPGSGSLLLIMDKKGRILTGSVSPSSIIHKNPIDKTVELELITALERIGIVVKKLEHHHHHH
nr:Chain A, HcgB [Methanococcus maripaludis S2]5D5P_B Chain B, HcgB [Methanococcus maripaludis S2]5D5P_C Chain C, HcgB [Methanococcus maripaludis S2]5D5P_D Chain D, HcgB [Methanococcus maripaludis S2]